MPDFSENFIKNAISTIFFWAPFRSYGGAKNMFAPQLFVWEAATPLAPGPSSSAALDPPLPLRQQVLPTYRNVRPVCAPYIHGCAVSGLMGH